MHTLCNLQQDVAYTCVNRLLCECVCVLTKVCVCVRVRVRTFVPSFMHVQLHTSVCARKCETPVYVFYININFVAADLSPSLFPPLVLLCL